MPKPKTDRTAAVYVRLTTFEKRLIKAAADADRRTVGKWAAMQLVESAKRQVAASESNASHGAERSS